MGGAAEHHFRKARPAVDELPWGTLVPSEYAPTAVARARASWTEVAINEYRAAASFTTVLGALLEVKAPLDLIGMTSDFLADECSHVELASRMAMELGGAVPRQVDMDRFVPRPRGPSAMQRANEIVLRISCIAEAFSGGTASVAYEGTAHPLTRAVYETILRDEAHHRRLGGLYFEWALSRIDEEELARLGRVLLQSLQSLAPFWNPRDSDYREPTSHAADLAALGWLVPQRFAEVSRQVVARDILDPLSAVGITIMTEEREALLG
jgi:hypothetical protein